MHQRHDWELQSRVPSLVPAKFFSWDFSRFKYLDRFQLDCFNGKKWFDGLIQLRIAAVGQSSSGLWYTCVHAKQLLIDPMYVWVEKIIKYSIYLRERGSLDQISLDRKSLFSLDRKFHFHLIKFFETFHLIKTFNNAFDQTPKMLSLDWKFY